MSDKTNIDNPSSVSTVVAPETGRWAWLRNVPKKLLRTEKEPEKIPQWYQHATDGMSLHDQQSITEVRRFFTDQGNSQHWYYSGSGRDISPTFIAPYDSEQWMVDVGYDSSHNWFQASFSQDLSKPYEKLGAHVKTAVPWDDGWRNKRQTVIIDGKTKLQLVGGKAQDKETVPDSIDVIYTNPYSYSPSPDALIKLKTGGYYVIGNLRSSTDTTKLRNFKKTLGDFGLQLVKNVKINTLHYPKAGKVAGTTDGKSLWYQVYEKSRAFTPEEEDMLQMESSLSEIAYELQMFLYRVSNENLQEEIDRHVEADLSQAFVRYFAGICHLKGNSEGLLHQVQARVEAYFPEDGTFPETLQKSDTFKKADQNKVYKVFSYHKKAAEIYRNIKGRFENSPKQV